MRRFLIVIGAIAAVALGLGLCAWLLRNSRAKSLPDGSVLRVEKVNFGKEEHVSIGGTLDKLKALLPQSLELKLFGPARAGGGSSWYQNTVYHTNENALYVYVSRHNLGKGFRSVDAQFALLIDEDGCLYAPTQCGGYDDRRLPPVTTPTGRMQYTVGWFRFEAFPRHQKKFRFLVYETPQGFVPQGAKMDHVEFLIANPALPPRPANWTIQSLPNTQSQDRVSFILSRVAIQTNSFKGWLAGQEWKSIQADYAFLEDGRPSTNWQALTTELYDSSGNFVSGDFEGRCFLCPRESAWKLRVRFFGTEMSPAASNAVMTLRGVSVPAPGKFVLLDRSQELQGVPVKVVTFGGAGGFSYSNGIALAAGPLGESTPENSANLIATPNNWTGKNSAAQPTYGVVAKSPHLALEVGDMSDDQRLTIRAVDDQGREYYAYKLGWRAHPSTSGNVEFLGNWYMGQGTFALLDLPADAKTVDLTICVHSCRTAEFIFKPSAANTPR